MLNEGQKILVDNSYVPASKKFPSPFANVPMKMIDPVKALEMQASWLKTFDEVFVNKSK